MTAEWKPLSPVVVELDPALHDLLAATGLVPDTRAAVAAATDELLDELGVPGEATVEVRPAQVPLRPDQPLRLTVGGRRCRYPDIVVRRAAEYHLGAALGPADDWRPGVTGSGALLVGVVAAVCRGALAARASVLLGPSQLTAVQAELPSAGIPPTETLLPVLREVLDLRLSLGDRATVERILREPHVDADVLREALIAELRPDVLEVAVHPTYLRQMTDTTNSDGQDDGMFAFLRRELFRELGIPLPALRIVRDDDLAPDAIRFRVNALCTLPLIGVSAGRLMVDEAASQLVDIPAAPATNPATGRPAALVDARYAEQLTNQGYVTWTPLGFLVLALAAAVRRNAHCLVNSTVTDGLVDQLRFAFPDLVRIATNCLPPWQNAALIRELAREKVSVRNLLRILDVVVEAVHEVGNGDVAALTTAVRAALAPQITGQHAQAGTTLVCYLVGAEVEEVLARRPPVADADLDSIAAAIAAELSFLPATASVPTIVTITQIRPMLADLVGVEFPHMSVVAFDELADTVVVQPVARVSLS